MITIAMYVTIAASFVGGLATGALIMAALAGRAYKRGRADAEADIAASDQAMDDAIAAVRPKLLDDELRDLTQGDTQ